jgi:hypothetical protein
LEEKIMKRLLILTCVGSLAFALAAGAADEPNKNQPKKGKGGNAAAVAVPKGQTNVHANTQVRSQHLNSTAPFRTHNANQTNVNLHPAMSAGARTNLNVHQNNHNVNVSNQANVGVHNQMNVRRQHANVTITNNWHGQQFSGQRYSAFRNYHREFHDRSWWRSHHNRIVFYFGAPYYWDDGYFYPALGYNPGFTYDYDGPIASYGGLAPDQVLIAVQTRLQEEGYYQDAVDGTMGPNTRQSLANWQTEHGLAVTAAVDEPTLRSMGLG